MTEIIWLKSVDKHKFLSMLESMIPISLKYFPELDHVYVGISGIRCNHKACADTDNFLVRFRVDLMPTFVTIFHELMHLVQHSIDAPKTEEYCSIYAMARMPEKFVDDTIPYIGGNPLKFKLSELCRDAVRYRESGKRDYIMYLRKKLFD